MNQKKIYQISITRFMIYLSIAVVLLVFMNSVGIYAQEVSWKQIYPLNSPPIRGSHSIAYDSGRGVVVLFGGKYGDQYENYGDTWEFNGTTWLLKYEYDSNNPTGSPSPRRTFAMAYDKSREVTVLYGGEIGAGITYGDTWEWDGICWERKDPSGENSFPPSARSGHQMIYSDQEQAVILFGGWERYQYLNDMWKWDGETWERIEYSGGPTKRASMGMAYDSKNNYLVIHGGINYSGHFVDTWIWDGATWMNLGTSIIPERHAHTMVYHKSLDRIFLYGGASGPNHEIYHSDTWEWDGLAWKLIGIGIPSERAPAGCYVSNRETVLIFGGACSGGWPGPYIFSDETWELGIPFIEASVDIDPDTLNLNSKGNWITAYIILPHDYDINNIDISSVRIEYMTDGFFAEWGKVQGDLLMVKFSRDSVCDMLKDVVGEVQLIIKGMVGDEYFKGTDTIRVIRKK